MTVTEQKAPFQLQRLGTIMEPEPDNPAEVWGVLNPASARRDGQLYLFPRLVAEGNYSRIGIARVNFDDEGDPVGVTRLGYALEPEAHFERSKRGTGGGVEDPRITFVEPLGCWVMAYTALSALGPRIALAVSKDLFTWERLGLLRYQPTSLVDFTQFDNKDGMLFPDAVLDTQGRPALAILHRPRYLRHSPDGTISLEVPEEVDEERESIWIAYISLDKAKEDVRNLTDAYDCRLLAAPVEPWESVKVGGGAPPTRIPQGWLAFYHGVSGTVSQDTFHQKRVRYSAGALVLDAESPRKILYRAKEPVLEPDVDHEQRGIVPNVVFPTAVDQRENGRVDVYYGMADSRIGVATTTVPAPASLDGRYPSKDSVA